MSMEMADAFKRDDTIRAIVVTGHGRSFALERPRRWRQHLGCRSLAQLNRIGRARQRRAVPRSHAQT